MAQRFPHQLEGCIEVAGAYEPYGPVPHVKRAVLAKAECGECVIEVAELGAGYVRLMGEGGKHVVRIVPLDDVEALRGAVAP